MSHFKRSLVSVVLLIALCISLFLLVSCDKDKNNPDNTPGNQTKTDYGIDNEYFMLEGGIEYHFTITGNKFLFSGMDGVQSGTFTYENGTLTLTFKDGDIKDASAKIDNDVLTLTYKGGTYRMLQRKQFAVTFDADGGSEIAPQTVLNGELATKPQDPAKDGYVFIGWYTDKNYTTAFSFNTTRITTATTVYARFMVKGHTEYKATLIGGGDQKPAETVGGILYNLPTPPEKEGMVFAGWWMSDSDDASKLTVRYDGQKLTQDVTLYARYEQNDTLMVSVDAKGVYWNSVGTNVPYYNVLVKCGSDEVLNTQATATSQAFDFSVKPAGEYTVTVTAANGKSATAYYRNKALERVSNLRVVSAGGKTLLLFDRVANAQYYFITARCGSASHTHANYNNGNNLTFDFTDCEMPASGITFVVTAKAEGYLDSIGSQFTYFLGLDAVSDITTDGTAIRWNPVENATGYIVSISRDGTTYRSYEVTSGTYYSIADLDAGDLYVKVTPTCAGFYVAPAEAVTFTKTILKCPDGVKLSDDKLVWNAVTGAAGYRVTINGVTYDTAEAALELREFVKDGTDNYAVSVQALARDAQAHSPASAAVRINYSSVSEVTYRDGYLYWSPVLNAAKYIITIGDSTEEIEVPATATSWPITFTGKGEVTLTVTYVDAQNKRPASASTTVEVFEVILDVRGGVAVSPLYYAKGDSVTLPTTTREGYILSGWYRTPYNAEARNEYADGTKFEGVDSILYAGWTEKKTTVSLDSGIDGTIDIDSVILAYCKKENIPTPTCTDPTKAFFGWYSEPNGAGIRYFDQNGEALDIWRSTKDHVTLYAHYVEVLAFTPVNGGESYSVSAGPLGIAGLTEVTIPTRYNGKPVTEIAPGGFKSCSTLVTINIPNTIEIINIGDDGVNSSTSSFVGCSELAAINIYEVEGAIEPKYHSVDGVLYITEFGESKIKCCPYAKTGVLKIEEGTTYIPSGAFKGTRVSEVQIPHTVTYVAANAFNSYYIKYIRFLETPDGAADAALEMVDTAIDSCSQLIEITIPSRVTSFTAKTVNDCMRLTSINIVGEGGRYSAKGEDGKKVLCSADGSKLIFCPQGMEGEFRIPFGVVTIGDGAFATCRSLTKVTIDGSVETIGKNAFDGNYRLKTVEIEDKGQPLTIRKGAFNKCSGLTQITLPWRLVKLEANAFAGTSKLTKVIVNTAGISDEAGNATVDFAVDAFVTADDKRESYVTDVTLSDNTPFFDIAGVFGKQLQNIYVTDTNPSFTSRDGILFDKAVTKLVFYPVERAGDYDLPETVVEIGAAVFQGRTELTGITIGKNVKTIGKSAFEGCNKLTTVTFTGGGEVALEIGERAFYQCKELTAAELPVRLTTIGASAFQNCYNMQTLTLPEGLTKIGESAFRSCRSLTAIALPSTLETIELTTEATQDTIGDKGACSVFFGCAALETLTIPESNRYYGTIDNVLYQKAEKTTIDAENNEVTTYVAVTLLYAPQRKAGATDVVTPGTVTKVNAWAFFANQKVTSIAFDDIADGVEFTIEENAFYGAATLTKVSLPKGLTTIAKGLFRSCSTLEEISIPSTVTSIGNSAFSGCTNLKKLTFVAPAEGEPVVPLVIEDAKTYKDAPFYGCASLTTLELPERLTVLGDFAFAGTEKKYNYSGSVTEYEYNHPITTIVFPSTLTRIGKNAFYFGKNLVSVTFAPGTILKDEGKVAAIGDKAFYYCSKLTSIALPAGDTAAPYTVGTQAFMWDGLTSVAIPAGLGKLGNQCFQYNKALTDVTFAEGAQPAFGTSVFASCGQLTAITLPEGTTEIGSSMFDSCKSLTSIVIPSSVTKIGSSAFNGCAALTNVTFATYTGTDGKAYSKVNNIGANAFTRTAITSFTFPTLEGTKTLTLAGNLFSGCTTLTSVTLSKSVGNLGSALTNCYSIRSFTVDPDNANYSAIEGDPILYNKTKTAYRYVAGLLVGEFRVGDNITEIGENAFQNQIALTKLIIPASVKTIGNNAFKGCILLETVVFEHSETEANQFAAGLTSQTKSTSIFEGCYDLKNVTLPANMTVIPNSMFRYCYSLASVELPSGLVTIGTYAFAETGLVSVTIPSSVKTIDTNAFAGPGASDFGKLENVTFAKKADGKYSLTKINGNAFRYQKLKAVSIPSTVTTLGIYAFSDNPELTTAVFEGGLTVIPANLFTNCVKLTSVTLPQNTTTISASVFKGCTSLETITLPSKLTTIKGSVFSGCTALTSVTIPAGVTIIDASAFADCTALTSVGMPDSLATIGKEAFLNCTALTSISLPDTIKTIGASAFKNCASLATVTFGNGVTELTKIDTDTFRDCSALTTIAIPDSVTTLGTTAFRGCVALSTVTFGEESKLTAMGNECFGGSGLTSISIPKGVTYFGYGTLQSKAGIGSVAQQFLDCTKLETVEFKGDFKLLGGKVFRNCTALTSITFPASIAQIGEYAFDGCTKLTTVTITAGGTEELKIGQYAFLNSALTAFAVPARTSEINQYAFDGCSQLATLTIPEDTVKLTLGKGVFRNCAALTSVALPDVVTALPDYAFNGCKKLASVTANKLTTIGNSAFSGCSALTAIALPETVTSIGADAFLNAGLTSFTVPKSCTEIGANVFGGCRHLATYAVADGNTAFTTFKVTQTETLLLRVGADDAPSTIIAAPGLLTGTATLPEDCLLGAYALNGLLKNVTSLVLPEGMEEIPDEAFFGSCIESITLPSTLKKIGESAFEGSNLKSITIPASVTEIGAYAFADCDSLSTVTFEEDAELTTLGKRVFAGSGLTKIELPVGVTTLYSDDPYDDCYTFYNCSKLTSVTFLGKLTVLNSQAFRGCTALKSFTIPASVKAMGVWVFVDSGLESITIPGTLERLCTRSATNLTYDGNTFRDCKSLKTVVFEEGVQYINGSAFKGCTALTSVTIPASVTGIGANTFEGCTALTDVNLAAGSKLETIGSKAFFGSALTSIAIPASVQTIGTYAFDGCATLKNVTFGANAQLTTIGTAAFRGTGLTAVALPTTLAEDGLTLGSSLFQDCTSLASVQLGDSVTKIDASTFQGCTALTSITIPASVTSIGKLAFSGSGLTSVKIPATVVTTGDSWFQDCLALTEVEFETGCTYIDDHTFDGCVSLRTVKLPDTIEKIDTYAFQGCTSISTLEIPASVTTVGMYAFGGWTKSQTIRVKASKIISQNWRHSLNKGWDGDCEAKVIWKWGVKETVYTGDGKSSVEIIFAENKILSLSIATEEGGETTGTTVSVTACTYDATTGVYTVTGDNLKTYTVTVTNGVATITEATDTTTQA